MTTPSDLDPEQLPHEVDHDGDSWRRKIANHLRDLREADPPPGDQWHQHYLYEALELVNFARPDLVDTDDVITRLLDLHA